MSGSRMADRAVLTLRQLLTNRSNDRALSPAGVLTVFALANMHARLAAAAQAPAVTVWDVLSDSQELDSLVARAAYLPDSLATGPDDAEPSISDVLRLARNTEWAPGALIDEELLGQLLEALASIEHLSQEADSTLLAQLTSTDVLSDVKTDAGTLDLKMADTINAVDPNALPPTSAGPLVGVALGPAAAAVGVGAVALSGNRAGETVAAPASPTNLAPTAVALSNKTTSLAENTATASRVKVADIAITDDALGTNAISLSGADTGSFEVDDGVLYLKAGTTLNFEGKSSYAVTVNVADAALSGSKPLSASYTLTVTDVNEAPTAVVLNNQTTSLAENTSMASRVKVADITINDDALGTNAISLSGADAASFEVDAGVLYLKAGTALNFEAKSGYAVTVNVADAALSGSTALSASYSLNVTNINEAPTVAATQAVPTTEDTGAQVTVAGADVDANDTLTYNAGSAGKGVVTGGAGGVFTYTPNLNTNGLDSFVVTVTDVAGLTAQQTVTVNVAAVNDAPARQAAATVNVAENTTVVGTFATTDVDNATLTYSLSGSDQALFNINADSGAVSFKVAPNYEAAQKSYSVNVVATDAGNLSASQAVTVNVTDVNEAPTAVVLNNQTSSLAENTSTASRVKVADIAITDDGLGTNAISLSGADTGSFEVDAGVLYLKAGTALNYEAQTSYAVTVNVADAGVANSTAVSTSYTLSVTNVDEVAPSITSGATASVAENVAANTVVYRAMSTDTADIATGVTSYSFKTGLMDDARAFTIAPETGVVTINASPDFETKPSYSFTVVATDAAGNAREQTVSVGVTNVAETLQVGAGKQFTTIQAAVNAAIDGDTIAIAAGTYTEVLNLGGKAITLDGAGKSGEMATTLVGTIQVPGNAQGPAQVQLNGALVIKDLAINAAGQQFGVGVQAASAQNTGAITLDNVAISGANSGGFNYTRAGNGDSNPTLRDTLGTITLKNSSFADNQNGASADGNSEISIYGYNQVLVIDGVSISGTAAEAVRGIQVRGLGTNGNEATYSAMSGLTLKDITINGAYSKSAVALQSYSDITETISGVVFNNVTTGFNTAFQADGVGGTLNLSGVSAMGTLLPASGNTPPTLTLVQSLGSADTYTGSAGTDAYVVGSTDSINAGAGMDTVVAAGNYAPSADAQLVGVESVVSLPGVATSIDLSAQSEGFVIVGNALADTIKGGQGNDAIDGGAGADTVVYAGALDEFTISDVDGVVSVTDGVMARGGSDVLRGVENIAFANNNVLSTFTVSQLLNKAATDLMLSATSVTENVVTTAGVKVGGIAITDPTGGANVLSLSGTDAGSFEVRNGTNGKELFFVGTSPNFETKPSYVLTITAADDNSGLPVSYSESFTISVTNVDEIAPSFLSGAAASVNENVAANTVVYTAVASDVPSQSNPNDGLSAITYSLKTGLMDNAAAFAIDATSGAVKIKASPDFETKPSYSFTVLAADAAGNKSEQAVSLEIKDVEPPIITELADSPRLFVEVTENSTNSIASAFLFEDGFIPRMPTVSAVYKGDLNSADDQGELSINSPLGSLTPTINSDQNLVEWSFQINPNFDGLGKDELLTQVFTTRVTNAGGEYVDQEVFVTIHGTNDAPVIGVGTFEAIAKSAMSNEFTADGAFQFSDADLNDQHQADFVGISASLVDEDGNTKDLEDLVGYFLPRINEANGQLVWHFSVEKSDISPLSPGQKLVQTYDVSVSDSNQGLAHHEVKVTILGVEQLVT